MLKRVKGRLHSDSHHTGRMAMPRPTRAKQDLTPLGPMRYVTYATRFRFLKTNPKGFSWPVIVSEQSQWLSGIPGGWQYNDEAVTDRSGGYKIKGHSK